MRLIDGDALVEALMMYTWTDEDGWEIDDAELKREYIKEWMPTLPTVDAVPVKHGQWLEDEKAYPGPDLSNYVCSSCKRVGGTWIKGLKPENLFTYCPWCGAKMDGKKVDE